MISLGYSQTPPAVLGGGQEEAAVMVSGQWLVEVASAGWICIDFDPIASASTL